MIVLPLRRALLAGLGLALAGCGTTGSSPAPFQFALPTLWTRANAPAQPVLRVEAREDFGDWWRRLDDPLLTALIDDAQQHSPDLRTAQARVREARARRTAAGANRYPGLTGSVQASRRRSSEETGSGNTQSFYSAGLDASWELDVFGGVRRGVEAAEADLDAARANLDGARVTLAAELALNYVEVRVAQRRLAIARANLDAQSETLQLVEWRTQAGLASSQEIEQARSNRAQTQAQIPALEIAQIEAEHTLDLLSGQPPGTLHARLAGDGTLPALPVQLAIGIPADTLRQRPDVRAAERAVAAETARLGAAEAARYPGFTLSGSIGLEALRFGALGNSGAAASSLLAGISAPLFDAGRLRAQAELQDAVRDRAQIAYEQAVLAALRDVENALTALDRSRARESALTEAARAAQNAADLARQRYQAGLIDFQAVLDTERTRLSVEDSLARTRADGVQALIRLYKALGGGWSPTRTDEDAS